MKKSVKTLFFIALLSLLTTVLAQYEGLYCGRKTCYEVLGLDASQAATITKKDVQKAYRIAQKEKHPDTVQTSTDDERLKAELEFHMIRTAYETLKDDAEKKKYDHLLAHPNEFYTLWYKEIGHKIGTSTNAGFVIILLLTVISVAQKFMHNNSVDHRINQICSDSSAQTYYINASKNAGVKVKAVSSTEKKDFLMLNCKEKIMNDYDMYVMGWSDTLWMTIIKSPLTVPARLMKTAKYFYSHSILRQPYSDDEKVELTFTALNMSEKQWNKLPVTEQTSFLKKELWISVNYYKYIEDNKKNAELAEIKQQLGAKNFKAFLKQQEKDSKKKN